VNRKATVTGGPRAKGQPAPHTDTVPRDRWRQGPDQPVVEPSGAATGRRGTR
jgi:hypothetical protein